jgi:putative oxidoreductase
MATSESRADDAGRLILRVSIAGLMLFHGVAKLRHGVGGIATTLARHGLPSGLAFGVLVGEVAAPILLLLGVGTRPAALVLVVNMLFAIGLVHAGDVGRLSTVGAWKIELQMLYLLGALAIALLGPGRWSLSRGRGSWWR